VYPGQRAPYAVPPANVRGPHLGSWLQNHQGESFTGQENALRHEPGFNRLPQPQQQRLINRLHQLDSMPPQQRQRWIGRNENMERLSPERRQEVRNSVQELNNMDPARKQQVRAAWRVLRDMPPAQRDHVLNSPAYRSMYNDRERQILGNLLSVEPYQPR
jgi:DNA-directed RNA polymerase subunit F